MQGKTLPGDGRELIDGKCTTCGIDVVIVYKDYIKCVYECGHGIGVPEHSQPIVKDDK